MPKDFQQNQWEKDLKCMTVGFNNFNEKSILTFKIPKFHDFSIDNTSALLMKCWMIVPDTTNKHYGPDCARYSHGQKEEKEKTLVNAGNATKNYRRLSKWAKQ